MNISLRFKTILYFYFNISHYKNIFKVVLSFIFLKYSLSILFLVPLVFYLDLFRSGVHFNHFKICSSLTYEGQDWE